MSFGDGRRDELVALLPLVAGVPAAGEERKKSGEDDATLLPFWFLEFLGVDILGLMSLIPIRLSCHFLR